jgi:hypothetical protein
LQETGFRRPSRADPGFITDAGPELAPSPTGASSADPGGSGSNRPIVRFSGFSRDAATAFT